MSDAPAPQTNRRPLSLTAAVGVLIANAIPILGVIHWGWDAAQILMLYWIENLIVGAAALTRVLTARGALLRSPVDPDSLTLPADGSLPNRALGGFFVLHYGLFCLVHGIFTAILVASFMDGPGALDRLAQIRDRVLLHPVFLWAIPAMVLIQGVLLARDWWLSGQWRTADPGVEMSRPYGRILVLHVTVLLGAWGLAAADAPTRTILILCVAKAVVELFIEVRGGLQARLSAGS